MVDADREPPAELYHQAIVETARRASGSGALPNPDASVDLDNPLCGDRVSLDVCVAEGRLGAVAHRVRGCLLCEAAASVIAANAVGKSTAELTGLDEILSRSLAEGFRQRPPPWPELAMFAPVARHRSRHRCVTLAFEALSRALEAAARRGRPGAG